MRDRNHGFALASSEFTSEFISGDDSSLSLAAADGIELNGKTFTPDDTKGYLKFSLSHGFPVVTQMGMGIHPHVSSISFESLLHQNFNLEHQVKAYHPTKDGERNRVRDRMVGSIVAVDFPRSRGSRHIIDADSPSKAITGVASFAKLAEGVDRVLGDHQSGKHKYTVSMEVRFAFAGSGFAVARPQAGRMGEYKDPKLNPDTPRDILQSGFEYVPFMEARPEILATFSKEKNKMVGKYQGRPTFLMMGGLDTPVHYSGVGWVRYGAEPTAGIQQLVASREFAINPEPFRMLAAAFCSLAARGSKEGATRQ